MLGNRQIRGQQNQIFNPLTFPGQFSGGSYSTRFGSHLGHGNLFMPPGQGSVFYNNLRGGGMGVPQRPFGVNQGWGPTSPFSAGGQGYSVPGYPPRGYGMQQPYHQPLLQQPLQQPMLPNQGYSPQAPVGEMSTWKPQKGGVKGFISNLIAKWKK